MSGRWVGVLMVALVMSGCGVSREPAEWARVEAVRPARAGEVAGARAALREQAAAWGRLESLLRQRELGGIAVEEKFVMLVSRTAALARRQSELAEAEAGEAEAGMNAEVLGELRELWVEAAGYLNR